MNLMFGPARLDDVADEIVSILEGNDRDNLRVYTARDAGLLVGFILLRVGPRDGWPGLWGTVQTMWVHEGYCGVSWMVDDKTADIDCCLLATAEDVLAGSGVDALLIPPGVCDNEAALESMGYRLTDAGYVATIRRVTFDA